MRNYLSRMSGICSFYLYLGHNFIHLLTTWDHNFIHLLTKKVKCEYPKTLQILFSSPEHYMLKRAFRVVLFLSSVVCRPSSVVRHLSSVVRHPSSTISLNIYIPCGKIFFWYLGQGHWLWSS